MIAATGEDVEETTEVTLDGLIEAIQALREQASTTPMSSEDAQHEIANLRQENKLLALSLKRVTAKFERAKLTSLDYSEDDEP